jgi:predicted hotdog family 3-hydroxylacyl-ACP dehydratase
MFEGDSGTMIPHEDLCQLIPHAANMCLLDKVLCWDENSIHCQAVGHRSESHPLRGKRGLASVHAIEYAAQAMAVHGSLLMPEGGPRQGYVVALRDVQLQVRWLDELLNVLDIKAQALTQSRAAMIYRFQVSANRQVVAQGRITVMNQTGISS